MKQKNSSRLLCFLAAACLFGCFVAQNAMGQQKRMVIIDQDASGPATTDTNSIALALQDPNVDVLGITVVTGDQWRDEEVAHTLRMLELLGRTDVPVVPGMVFPLVRTLPMTLLREHKYGHIIWMGAFNPGEHGPYVVPNLIEGNPTTKPLDEDAAHFMIRMVRKYPHQVTIYAGGPMTDIATAVVIDPQFASLAKELVVMGGSISPHTNDPEYIDTPRREFNFWFDPEAASIVLHAAWPKVVVTTVDVSVQTHLTQRMLDELAKSHAPAAQYVAQYTKRPGAYLWDELAVASWIDPSLITRVRHVYMDVSLDKGISYGDTEVWTDEDRPANPPDKVTAQMDVNWPKFRAMFMRMMTAPTPGAKNPQMRFAAEPQKQN